jgi:hypothetical protein
VESNERAELLEQTRLLVEQKREARRRGRIAIAVNGELWHGSGRVRSCAACRQGAVHLDLFVAGRDGRSVPRQPALAPLLAKRVRQGSFQGRRPVDVAFAVLAQQRGIDAQPGADAAADSATGVFTPLENGVLKGTIASRAPRPSAGALASEWRRVGPRRAGRLGPGAFALCAAFRPGFPAGECGRERRSPRPHSMCGRTGRAPAH